MTDFEHDYSWANSQITGNDSPRFRNYLIILCEIDHKTSEMQQYPVWLATLDAVKNLVSTFLEAGHQIYSIWDVKQKKRVEYSVEVRIQE